MRTLYLFFFLTIIFSCSEEKKPAFNLPTNPEALLTADSTKTWKLARRFNNKVRMNMGDCFLSYQVTYNDNGEIIDNNGQHDDCGDSMSSNWTFYKSDDNYPYIKLKGGNIQQLMNLEKDYKFFKILDLSNEQMVLEFKHKQYSNKKTTIVDVFVPLDAKIKDRKFHW